MDTPPSAVEINKPTPKIENTSKSIKIEVNKKIFKIDFINEIKTLKIVAKNTDGLVPIEYSGIFTLEDIKKVGLFFDYESIDECLFEIFGGLDSSPSVSEKENLELIISVPLHTRKYPEISFLLKMIKKNESQKYEDLYEALLNIKNQKDKEIEELKDRIKKLENLLQIKDEKNSEGEKEFKGTKLELFCITKDKYFEYFPDKNKYGKEIIFINCSLILECNENDVKNLVDALNKNKDEIKEMLSLKEEIEIYISDNKNNINIHIVEMLDINDKNDKQKQDYLFKDIIRNPLVYFPFTGTGLKATLKTDATFLDLFELENNDILDNIIFNTTFSMEGLTLQCQIFWSLLTLLILNDKEEKTEKIFNILNDIFLTLINGNTNYKIMNKEMFDDYENDKKKILQFLKIISYKGVSMFKDPKYRVLQKINFNKIKIGFFGSPKFKVGFGLNFESPKNNEFIDKVLNDKIKYEEDPNDKKLNRKLDLNDKFEYENEDIFY